MANKSVQENYFVAQVLRHGLAQDAGEAAIWFRRHKAWRLSPEQALRDYRQSRDAQAMPANVPGSFPLPPVARVNLWSGRAAASTELLQARAALRLMVAAFSNDESRDPARCPDAAEALAAAELVLRAPIRH